MISFYLEMWVYRLAGDWISASVAQAHLDLEKGNRA